MTSDRNHTAPPPPVDGRGAMALALEQTHDVKEKVELCADSLGSSNDIAKKSIAEGTNPLSARESLANNERVLLSLSTGDLQPVIKASIGVAIYPDNGATGEQLIGNADTAMYRAKKSMTGCVFFNALDTEGTSAISPGLRS